ncbi:hypothetical protein ACI3L1_18400 [Deinococcus sp. SM5_A1]|uniref:hypothetical protein n=1 Tax=Deinococcus sp. SM5_A1 TaxID=3379094 RepID=UPI00385DA322
MPTPRPEPVGVTLTQLGNVIAASLPLTLHQALAGGLGAGREWAIRYWWARERGCSPGA